MGAAAAGAMAAAGSVCAAQQPCSLVPLADEEAAMLAATHAEAAATHSAAATSFGDEGTGCFTLLESGGIDVSVTGT